MILAVDGVTKRFGGVIAVRSVSMEVEEGSITAIIGPNGAGKTSLFNVVTGFEALDEGDVRFRGERIDGLEPWQIARRGLVRSFQTPVGFPALSVWENLMLAGSNTVSESLAAALLGRWRTRETEIDMRAESLLRTLELWERRDTEIRDLTPGDVKLVDFARQLMARPTMLLLDEPASGVDPRSIGRLSGLIRGLSAEGITALIIDHNIGFVLGIADRVHVMALGAVIASGPPEAIVKDPQVMELYLGKRT